MNRNRILIVDDEECYRDLLSERLTRKGYEIAVAEDGRAALALAEERAFAVALLDVMMPGMDGLEVLRCLKEADPSIEAIMLTGHASIDSAIKAMKLGAHDYLSKPYKLAELDVVVARALEKRKLAHRCAALAAEVHSLRERNGVNLIGESVAWRRTVGLVQKAAAADVPVLITGESGVGKELVATALHRWGPRGEQPLVPVDCGALPEHLVESELFGHRRGAFTGAVVDKEGLFQTAGTGTIFLDEIGELSATSQAKLLRVLETGDFRPLGQTSVRRTEARVVAATNRDLAAEAAAGRFRQDLYYRLNVVNVEVPPLRERREDVPLLATHFLQRSTIGRQGGVTFAPGALKRLMDYAWPGNVRELRNMVERLLVIGDGPRMEEALVASLLAAAPTKINSAASGFAELLPLAQMERGYVAWALAQCAGNMSTAAKRLGISRSTLYRLLQAS